MDVARNTSNGLTGDETCHVVAISRETWHPMFLMVLSCASFWKKRGKKYRNIVLRMKKKRRWKVEGNLSLDPKNRDRNELFDESFLKILFHESLWRISRIYLSSTTAKGKEKGGKERDTEQSPLTLLYGYNRSCLLSFRRSFPFRSEPHAYTCAAWRSPCTLGYPKTVEESWCRLLASKRTGNCAQGGLRKISWRKILKFRPGRLTGES